ncbi:PaaI family thioesterase [Mycolicibacterium hodleri]|uniref:PaaI family thioesterase n=1 Tax=Mycolicibacterium hodleri TaxID=49897 RepID=A0A502E7H7_9MYCO|nr:PaaI family thioesterase [Mycolicibacterium hodleri]TPG32390.1 PaaI family thioesterase [Mycolicibacterium hodleri]
MDADRDVGSGSEPPAIQWHPPIGDDTDWVAWAGNLPLCRELGLVCLAVGARSATFVLDEVPMSPNPNGAVNGGLVATVADQAMGVIAVRMSPPGMLPATAALHIQFHSPALTPLTLRASALGGGKRVIYVEVAVEDRDGRRCATSQGTMVVGGSWTSC